MTTKAEYVLCSVCEYDDGTMSVQPLQRGDRDACELVASRIHAISHSGPRTPTAAYLTLLESSEYDAAVAEEPTA